MKRKSLLIALSLCNTAAMANIGKDLGYPSATPNAEDIAKQTYYVNHFYAFKNYGIGKKGSPEAIILSKAPDGKVSANTVRRYLNNDYAAGNKINARDISIFGYGKLKGTGILITDYSDPAKSQSYEIWMPKLRKVRRFAQPAHEDAWGGTLFTFGDVILRKPQHETHELLGSATFEGCLGRLEGAKLDKLDNPPAASCAPDGRSVYKLKSSTKFENWWYDYRVSYIDSDSFADYRTDYFKNGEHIKRIDRDWVKMGEADKRAQSWRYWYGKDMTTGKEAWVVIPEETVEYNTDRPSKFWTQSTLRKIKR